MLGATVGGGTVGVGASVVTATGWETAVGV